MKKIMLSLFICCLSACHFPTIPTFTHNMKNEFDVKQAQNLLKNGKNTIIGNAFLRQRGGGIVTCAGQEVHLIPATVYADERMFYLYLGVKQGFTSALPQKNIVFIPDSSEYKNLMKKTICDSSGHFKFNNIADGSFYITVPVIWEIATNQYHRSIEGGYLMQKVEVEKGKVKEIVITQ